MGFRHVNDRKPSFIAHLPGPHLTRSCRAFSTTFKTTVFSQRPLPWFRAFFRKTALEGQQTLVTQADLFIRASVHVGASGSVVFPTLVPYALGWLLSSNC